MKKNTHVKIHAKGLEENTLQQIRGIGDHPAIKGLVAIMPDAHYGKGCVIGFTGTFHNAVIPNLVGVDIGCGVSTVKIPAAVIHFKRFDNYLRKHIPLGHSKHDLDLDRAYQKPLWWSNDRGAKAHAIRCKKFYDKHNRTPGSTPLNQLGTMGGGNHFIEFGADGEGSFYLTVHSGSRRFGLEVAKYYQEKAELITKQMGVDLPKDLAMLPLDGGGRDYLRDMFVAQQYASLNRKLMLQVALSYFMIPISDVEVLESVHNYIDFDGAKADLSNGIIRKGAISAREGEKVVIPLSSGVGIIIGTGKGNKDYNHSAPHGAGRLYGRKAMERKLAAGEFTMEQFEESMSHVWSSCVTKKHIDEAPFAYKDYESTVKEYLEETVDVHQIVRPVYNLKG